MIKMKFDVLAKLKEKGINTTEIRKNNYFGQRTLQELKRGEVKGITTLNTICTLLEMQPGSIIRFEPDPDKKEDTAAGQDKQNNSP